MEVPEAHAEQQHVNKSEAREIVEAAMPEEDPKPVPTEEQAEPKTPEPAPEAKTVPVQQPTPAPPAGSCEDAIAKVWPAALQDGARLVALKESSMRTDAIGTANSDGSQDFGCFQINNRYHPQFFASGDWRDPVHNAQYALRLYQERGNWSAWYAVRGILW